MVNIEKITSTLAKLPDQALQRYAMMHKDDPYIVALAVSESNRRKEMRAASQAQPVQQQPKVVDQAVAEMAPQQMPAMPEEQGIGALPVQMDFADGGITGYAGGGEVARYAPGGVAASLSSADLSRLYQVDPKLAADAAKGARLAEAAHLLRTFAVPGAVFDGGVAATMKAGNDLANMTPEQRKGLYSNPMMGAMSGDAGLAGAIMNAPDQAPAKPTSWGDIGNAISLPLRALIGDPSLDVERNKRDAASKREAPAQAKAAVESAAYDPTKATLRSEYEKSSSGEGGGAAGRTASDQLGAYRAGPSAARTPAEPAMSIEDRFLESQKRLTGQANPYQTQEDALAAEQKKFAEDKLAATIERNEKFKDAFKGREGRIEERAKELEKSKDTNTGLAFLEAGLAIMATPGGLATAIGKGAREGTAKYAAGIEKLRSAKEKLDEARDRMEELKLNRDEMSTKEIMEAKLGIQQAVISGKKDALSSAKTLFGERSALSQAIVKETLSAEEKAKDRATQVQTAGAAAAIALGPQNKFIQDWLSKKENEGKSYSDAYAAFKNLGAASERNDITGLKAVQAGLIKEISENLTMTKAEKAAKQAQINEINNRILALTGAAAPSTTGGAQRTIDWNSIK